MQNTNTNTVDTIEGNRLIAEFDKRLFYGKTIDKFGGDTFNELPEMKYHLSWDWLHPVIEKIKPYWYHDNDEANSVCAFSICTNIKTIWDAVVKFIQWYNQSVNKQ